MPSLALLIPALLAVSLAWPILRGSLSLLSNIRYAQSTGLKYIVYPIVGVDTLPFELLSFPAVHTLVRLLPPAWQDYFWMGSYRTHWWVKERMAQRYGDLFLVVSPGRLCCVVSDPNAIAEILSDRKRFPKPLENYQVLNLYGPNIGTTEGNQWLHHKKAVVSPFGERNYRLVWQTVLQQAVDMVQMWEEAPRPVGGAMGVRQPNAHDGFASLTLHTIVGAAYGIEMKFVHEGTPTRKEGEELDLFTDGDTPPEGYTFSFRGTLKFIANNLIVHLIVLTALPRWLSQMNISFLQPHYQVYDDFKRYLGAVVSKAGKSDRNTLLDLLVAAATEKKGGAEEDGAVPLSTEELMGNLFAFTLAGHETTAQTLHYSLLMLALHPEVQAWVREGVDDVLKNQPRNPQEWKYEEVFPQLSRPLCLMLETLRLINITPFIPKSTGPAGTTVTYAGKPVFLRPMYIVISHTSGQRSEQAYGPDVFDYDPRRWDATNDSSYLAKNKGMQGLMAPGLEYPTLHRPVRGGFFAFSDGPRQCLGKKFAQVMFVATISVLLRDFEVEIATMDGETMEDAKGRVWRVIEGSWATTTLQAREEVKVNFKRRFP